MLSTLGSQNVFLGTLSHDALGTGTLHHRELSTKSAMLFVNIFMNTIALPHSTMPLPAVRRSGLTNTFTTLGPENGIGSDGLTLYFT